MYLNHFGLIQYPFSLTPNTRYFFKLPAHQNALEQLQQTLQKNEEFAVIYGEVGTGKTLLCRKVLFALDAHKTKFRTAYISQPVLSDEGLLHAVADELELQHDDSLSYKELIRLISNSLIAEKAEGRRVVLFIDEAQAMPEETLATLYLLTTLGGSETNLQVVLFGQPELISLLDLPQLRQLRKSVSFIYSLPSLDQINTKAYIEFRLAKAGYHGDQLFTDAAIGKLFQASRGIPRLINVLCHKALMVGFGLGEHTIQEIHAERAINDTDSVEREKSLKRRLFGL